MGERKTRSLRGALSAGVAALAAAMLAGCGAGGPSLASIEARVANGAGGSSLAHSQVVCVAKVLDRNLSASTLKSWVGGELTGSQVRHSHPGTISAALRTCSGG